MISGALAAQLAVLGGTVQEHVQEALDVVSARWQAEIGWTWRKLEHDDPPGRTVKTGGNGPPQEWLFDSLKPGAFNAELRQPPPVGDGQVILDLVVADLRARADAGELKYGTKLRAFNGRDALLDAYQEALDLVMYLRQAMVEAAAPVHVRPDYLREENDLA